MTTYREDLMTADWKSLTQPERGERIRRNQEEILKRRAEQRAKEDAAFKLDWAVLRDAGVDDVTVEYSGGGDSGCYEGVTIDGEPFEETVVKGVDEARLASYLMRFVDTEFAGWEINDGGRGEVTLDVPEGKVTINHTRYYTSEDCSEIELSVV